MSAADAPGAEQLMLPPLRQELRIEPGAALITGAPSWTLFDPVRHLFFQLGRIEFKILSRWANGDIAGVREDLAADGMDDEAINSAFARVVEFSLSNSLTVTPLGDSVASFTAQRESARKAWWKWMIDNYLFIRIPLVKPAAFLERTIAKVAPLWSYPSLIFFALLALTGLVMVARQWDQFLASFLYFFSWQGLIAYGLGLFVIKILHELGHAYTATRFGCRIPSMGISFLVMMPVLYTDTSGAWRLTSRRQRLMIDCAGVTVELMIAGLATMAWVLMPDGLLRSVAFILATTSWVMSLAINLNPFMRFDGYYVLSDWLGVPNLQPRAFALGRWRLRELLFNLGDAPPEQAPDRLRRGMIIYAWMTWIYRFFLFIGIALLVYTLFFKLLGIILFVVEIVVFIARPVWSEFKIWGSMKDRILATSRTRWLLALGGAALLLSLLPLDRHITAPAVLTPVGAVPLVAGDPARIDELLVSNGARVARGDPVARLTAPELEQAIAASEVRIARLEVQLGRGAADAIDLSNRMVLERELQQEQDQLRGFRQRSDRLILRAPMAGIVTDLTPDMHAGRWLGGAEPIATIITSEDVDVQAYVSEDDIWRIADDARGRFVPDDPVQPSRAAKLVEKSSNAVERLDQPILASVNGGAIATDEDENMLRPREALYRVRLIAAKQRYQPGDLPQVTPGRVEIDARGRSLFGMMADSFTRLFRQEASFSS